MICKSLSSDKTVLFLRVTIMAVILTITFSAPQRLRIKERMKDKLGNIKYQYNYFKKFQTSKVDARRARHLDPINNIMLTVSRRGYLYCKTGFFLEIHDNGRINGTSNTSSPHALIEMQAFGNELRRMKGVVTGRFLSLSNTIRGGRLVSTFSEDKDSLFTQNLEEHVWSTYSSKRTAHICGDNVVQGKEKEWFIAIKENGNLRRPCKTNPSMDAAHFLFLAPHEMKILEHAPHNS